jgi:hypothetical protein
MLCEELVHFDKHEFLNKNRKLVQGRAVWCRTSCFGMHSSADSGIPNF